MSQTPLSFAVAVAKSPATFLKFWWRGVFPLGIIPKDPEAFRIGGWSAGLLKRGKVTDLFPDIGTQGVTIDRVYDRDPGTSIDFLEIATLCTVARHIKARRVLEIGTFNGNTALNLALNLPEAELVTVDLPPDWDRKLAIDIPDLYRNSTERSTVGIQFREHECGSRIRQVFGDSATLDWSTLGSEFDLIFIDGNHHYDYVRSDTENALKLLAPGGIIAWHDYGMMDDVSRAVDDEERLEKFAIAGTRLVFGRRRAPTAGGWSVAPRALIEA